MKSVEPRWAPARLIRSRSSPLSPAAALGPMILLSLPLAGWISPGAGFAAQCGREAVYWAFTAFLFVYVLGIERRPLASVGWRRPQWKTVVFGLSAAAVMVLGMAAIYVVVFPAIGSSSSETALTSVRALPRWFLLILTLRAAVLEELFYRGFMIERLTEMTGRRWLAATVSWLAFTLAHLSYWGWAHLLVAGFGGVVLTALYLVRRDLGCNMLAHGVCDLVGLVAG